MIMHLLLRYRCLGSQWLPDEKDPKSRYAKPGEVASLALLMGKAESRASYRQSVRGPEIGGIFDALSPK